MCPPGIMICAYTYQYLLTVHLLGVAVLVAATLALGIRPSLNKGHSSHTVMLLGVCYVASQIPITVVRLHVASQIGFKLANPVDAYINFMWSPMATVVLLWLYMSHMVSSCITCDMDVPKENIDAQPKLVLAGYAAALGIGFNYVVYDHVIPFFDLDGMLVLRILFGTAVAISLLEIIYIRTRYNKVRLFNFTWFAYIGTWLYLLAKAR